MTSVRGSRLSRFLSEELRYLLLIFDDHHQLINYEGNTEFYGFDTNTLCGKNSEDILPFMTGVDTTIDQTLSYLEFIPNIITDIYIYPNASGFEVILLETSKQHDAQQAIQQHSNENAILQYRLQQLSEKLETNNHMLEKANNAKSEFIATASHELKTPLSSILGYAELLEKYKENPEFENAVAAISRSGNYLLSLIDNLLEQGRVESSQVAIQRHPCRLATLLTDIESIVLPLVNKKQLSFKVENNIGDILFDLDEQHVRQVLINLLTNAVKYTEKGSILLQADNIDGLLQFSIIDTGIGIPESELDEVMLPFRRAGYRNSIEGIGLGLSVSKKLATLMGGDLTIASKIGQGTTVVFTIPVQATAIEKSAPLKRQKNAHILLVEDDTDLSLLFEKILAQQGFGVKTVMDKNNLDQALSTHQPDIILMDHDVNGDNGLDLVRYLGQQNYAGKIIMMTASSEQSLVDQALKAGCSDFLQKPIGKERLLETIQALLK